jgi:hypothetical protein
MENLETEEYKGAGLGVEKRFQSKTMSGFELI